MHQRHQENNPHPSIDGARHPAPKHPVLPPVTQAHDNENFGMETPNLPSNQDATGAHLPHFPTNSAWHLLESPIGRPPSRGALYTCNSTFNNHFAHIGTGGFEDAAALFVPYHSLCPFEPGLAPIETILPPFATSVDYHHYRVLKAAATPAVSKLRIIYRFKNQIDVLHRTLGALDVFFANTSSRVSSNS